MSQMRSQMLGVTAGAVVAAAAAIAAWLFVPGPWRDSGPSAIDQALERRQELQARYGAPEPARPEPEAQATPQPIAPASRPPATPARACAFAPVLTRSTAEDGRFSARAAAGMRSLPHADVYVSVARDAAAHGRNRDAEAALVVACRLQGRQAPGSESLADIESALAGHYVDVAQHEPQAQLRTQALARARDLLGDAARIYAGVLGAQAHKTRASEQALREAAKEDPAVDVSTASAAQVKVTAPEPVRNSEPRRKQPDAMVADDPELAQLESDLQRLRQQAASVTDDPEGLRRRSAEALARRGHCQDRECLLHWYAQRRRSLLGEF